jgi:hypothetical protein
MRNTFSGQDWLALADHVAPYRIDSERPTEFVSTFNAALRDARVVCGRDADRGMLLATTPTALWAGTLVYFALLDQIGHTLRPVSGRTVKGESSIERVLREFAPTTTKRQREAIYALRNAFAHEFGLVNINRRKPQYTHAFAVDDTVGQPLIRWPSRRWDGDLRKVSPRTRTIVALPAFGDLCESVVKSVREHSNSTRLRGQVPSAELQQRYAFRITANI